MASFIESPRFPEKVSEGSTGGPRWETRVVVSGSGHEQRDQRWQNAMHEYNAAFGIRDMDDLELVLEFFQAMRGMTYGFRYKDWADHKSSPYGAAVSMLDQQIGVGDDVTATFQLIKEYTQGFQYTRTISKPVVGTAIVAVDGAEVSMPANGNVNYATGLVTLVTPPAAGQIVTAGFEFDVPCRFASDTLTTSLESYQVGSTTIGIREIRV